LQLLVISLPWAYCVYDWSFQQRILVPDEGTTYASTPPALFGRGFITLLSGYSGNDGIYIHTNDHGYVKNGQYVWSQQAKLISRDIEPGDRFGAFMVASQSTLIVSAPSALNHRGIVYVFNGTQRHWSQIQRIVALEGTSNKYFGERMSLSGNKLLIAAKGTSRSTATSTGVVCVYERPANGLYWSRQGSLYPRDLSLNHFFGQSLSLYDDTAVITARNDESNTYTGSAYIFREYGAQWSQQQKLISIDMQNYKNGLQLEVHLLSV
jgi:hypothetical protein